MELGLEDDRDGTAGLAARAALVAAGMAMEDGSSPSAYAWWRAGVEEALERTPAGAVPSRYEAARSPRSTRGATRA